MASQIKGVIQKAVALLMLTAFAAAQTPQYMPRGGGKFSGPVRFNGVPWVDVSGAVCNGDPANAATDTAAIKAALSAALLQCQAHVPNYGTPCPAVRFPMGVCEVNQPLTYQSNPWVGYGSYLSAIVWAGTAGGTFIEQPVVSGSNQASFGGIYGLSIRNGTNRPATILKFDSQVDQTFNFEDVALQGASLYCLDMSAGFVNFHPGKMRFDGCYWDGHAVYDHGLSFDLSQATSDKSGAASSPLGFWLFESNNGGNPRSSFAFRGGRFECCSDATTFAAGAAFVKFVNSTAAPNSKGLAADVSFEHLRVQGPAAGLNKLATIACDVHTSGDCATNDGVSGYGLFGFSMLDYRMSTTCSTSVFAAGSSINGGGVTLSGVDGVACYTPKAGLDSNGGLEQINGGLMPASSQLIGTDSNGRPADRTKTGVEFNNAADANFYPIGCQAGSTVDENCGFRFRDHTGTIRASVTRTGGGQYRVTDEVTGKIPFEAQMGTNSDTYMRSQGTGANRFNVSNGGTGGNLFGDGAGNVKATIDSTGKGTFTGGLALASLFASSTAPTIFSGFGTTPSISAPNGTPSFTVTVGTGGTDTGGTITMPAAANRWNCQATNETAAAANRSDGTIVVSSTATSIGLQNQTKSTGAAIAWTAGDVLVVNCSAM